MIETRDKYKELIRRPIRNACHLKVQFGIVEPDAEKNSTLSDNGHTYFSNLDRIEKGLELPTRQYGTFEDYFWVLDDSQEIPRRQDVEQLYQGFIGNKLSNSDGVYEDPTEITIDYGENPFDMIGITLTFDELSGDYASEVNILTYLDGEEVDNFMVRPTSPRIEIERPLSLHNKMVLRFLKSNKPYRRVRLMEIIYGIVKIYNTADYKDKSNIMSATEDKEISVVNKVLPKNDFSFVINNIDGEFDTDNPTGISRFLTERQPITYWWGIEDDDGEVEWILGGNVLSKSEFDANFTSVTIPCTDRLTLMGDKYNKGLYRPDGITLYDLAVEVLEWADLGTDEQGEKMYYVDDILKEYTTVAPLPNETGKSCLQIIATAANCLLYTDRYGKIIIKPMTNVSTGYELDYDLFLKEPPRTNLINIVKDISSEYYTYTVASNATQIAKLETKLTGTETLIISYNDATEVSATITGGTIDNAIYYAKSCELTVTGNGDITILVNGKKLEKNATNVTININPVGTNTTYVNPLITDYASCERLVNFVANAIENRNIYESEFRGDPSLDVLDIVNSETKFTKSMDSIITRLGIVYNGGFNGTVKFLKKDLT